MVKSNNRVLILFTMDVELPTTAHGKVSGPKSNKEGEIRKKKEKSVKENTRKP